MGKQSRCGHADALIRDLWPRPARTVECRVARVTEIRPPQRGRSPSSAINVCWSPKARRTRRWLPIPNGDAQGVEQLVYGGEHRSDILQLSGVDGHGEVAARRHSDSRPAFSAGMLRADLRPGRGDADLKRAATRARVSRSQRTVASQRHRPPGRRRPENNLQARGMLV